MTRAERRALLRQMLSSATQVPGHLEPSLRSAAAHGDGPLPPDLDALVSKIKGCAAQVTDEDIAALLAAGHTDDQLFELTVATALGASNDRLTAALRALGRESVCASPA